ncbi:HTH_Tnp_Tc3_2 domain-containing protein [Trichonephila clavipes]|nr:HTH_Tnp_Tc3_2 domain-containing protein [Trichonephila clavipes]
MCWNQWIEETSFTRLQGTGHPPQISHRENDTHIEPTASLPAVQIQVASSLRAPVSSRIIARRLAEGHLVLRRPLRVLPMTSTHRRLRLEWCHA